MTPARIDLDANASTRVSSMAREAFFEVISMGPLNPSSPHRAGDDARRLLARARDAIADAIGPSCDPDDLYFTSGGTESNNLVIGGFMALDNAGVVHLAVEHPSVAGPAARVPGRNAVIPVGTNGYGDADSLVSAVKAMPGPVLACIQAANSETGIMQPLHDLVAAVRAGRSDAYVMVDAAQAFGRIGIGIDGVDALTFSGHKIHAPPGTGALWMSDRLREILPRLVLGGGQERGVRPGTQNVAGAHALAAAVTERKEVFPTAVGRMRMLRDMFESAVLSLVQDCEIIGAASLRVPNTSNIRFGGCDAQALLARLDAAGVSCSAGSACSSARPEPSPVLRAMGIREFDAASCLRFSVSVMNEHEEIEMAAEVIADCVAEERRWSTHAA